jgi:hypothetical protein
VAALEDMVHQFRLEEFKALRAELLLQIQFIDNIKFWVAASMAAYYSFLATKFVGTTDGRLAIEGPILVWIIPILVPILALLRLHSYMDQLQLFSDYILRIEALYPGLEGWEHFYRREQARDTVIWSDYLYFILLLLFSMAVLYLRLNRQPKFAAPSDS